MCLSWNKLMFVALILSQVVWGFSYGNDQGPNSVVAKINGKSIYYKDIKVDPELLRPALGDVNDARLESEVHRCQLRRLAGKIHEVIFEQKVRELGLTVSEKEVDARVEELFQKAEMTDEKANRLLQSIQSLYEALAAWQRNPSLGDAIYNEKLRGSLISKEQWKMFQVCCDTPEKLEKLFVPKSIADMKRSSRESSRRDVLAKKLMDVVTKDVSVGPEEVEAAYIKKYGHLSKKPTLEEVRDELAVELLRQKKDEAMKLWWRERYKEAQIEIKDERFAGVTAILNK